MNAEQGPQRSPLPPPLSPPWPASPPRSSLPPPPLVPPRPVFPPRPVLPPLPVLPPRPAAASRSARLAAAVICLVLGAGLLGGAVAGTWLTGGATAAREVFDDARSLWREVPVDELFPAELNGEGAGPGGADRRWIRVAVARDSGCGKAFDAALADVLAQAGCDRLVRATYVDETESSVITVGLLFTGTDAAGMRALRATFQEQGLASHADLMPKTYAPAGTLAEGFGDRQRASWIVRVMTSLPVVAYAVSGFADGRTITDPQPAAEATAEGQDTTVALAGLGHDAKGVCGLVANGVRRSADAYAQGHG